MKSNEWFSAPLEEVIEKFIDYRGKTPKKTGKGIPLITAKVIKNGFILPTNEFIDNEDYDNWMRRGIPEYGDVVLTTEAPLGEVAQILTRNKIALAQRVITLRGKPHILDNTYLKYALQSPLIQHRLRERESGSTVTGIKSSELKKVTIDFPSYEDQIKIAKVLNSLDSKIQLNIGIIKNLEEISQTLYKHWFIDFEFPNVEGLPFKSSGGIMVESELGKMPEGWHVGTAKEIFDFSPTEKVKKGESIPYVEMKNLNTSAMIFDWTDREFTGSGSKFRQGDTLLARITPCLENGKIGYVDFLKENAIGWGSTEFVIIRSKTDIQKSFSYFFASESNFKDFAVSNMNGSSGRQRVKAETLADYKMFIPPIEIINQYTEITEKNMSYMSNLKNQILYLQELRDSLLPKLLTGEIEIPDESVVD